MSVNVQRHGNRGNPKVSVTNLPPTGVGSGDAHASKNRLDEKSHPYKKVTKIWTFSIALCMDDFPKHANMQMLP